MLLAILVPACDDKRRHGVGKGVDFAEVEPPVGKDATVEAVALATLDALREAQLSRARGLGQAEAKAAYEKAMQSLRSLAAAKEIHEQTKSAAITGLPRNITEAAAVTHAVENWVSLVAHYVEGFQLGTLTITELAPNVQAVAMVDAISPRDKAVLDELQTGATTAPADDKLRAAAIEKGVCPPINAGIEIRLKMVDGSWRVLRVGIGPSRVPVTRNAAAGSTEHENASRQLSKSQG